jgi:ribonuclease E
MPNKMLIDATHPEETRVVVLRGNRVEEFDFESANRKQLRGNIYLAKVTRVEPSLQAAFVDYGGNRHGFLAFSEIHPDYYQIPVADRQALLAEEERAQKAADADADHRARGGRGRGRHRQRGAERHRETRRSEPVSDEPVAAEEAARAVEEIQSNPPLPGEASPEQLPEAAAEAAPAPADPDAPDEAREAYESPMGDVELPAAHLAEEANAAAEAEASDHAAEMETGETLAAEEGPGETREPAEAGNGEAAAENGNGGDAAEEEGVESVGGADALEEVQERAPRFRRQYKIQEVIKRRQVMLVQVVKEERGSKGAALTTYLSLAGRYSVLMPNTARGGGISRKITSGEDRTRLKEIAQELEVPEGMGVILRTAGANRTKLEVKRDFEYLLRLWETVRDLTLQSTAPKLVYEEGSLTRRSLRDLYNKDIDEIVVSGEAAYRDAREFMRMLMPGHAKHVKLYRDSQPIFTRYGVESQLDAMFSPVVQLRSGGYIVINQAEALVAIDVNSGRATREHHIEDTALKTNIEAAEEVARQLRLRDLAGLIVIDFIDMDEGRNNRTVERRLKEALKHDRARIQVGRISHFGLMEMSRQRIRTSVLESSTEKCPVCGGSGHVRSVSSVALQCLRAIEEMLIKGATHNLLVRTRAEVALYVLNHKRAHLRSLEERFRITITVSADPTVAGAQSYVIDRGEQVHTPDAAKAIAAAQPEMPAPVEEDEEEDVVETDETEADVAAEAEAEAEPEAFGLEATEAMTEQPFGNGHRQENGGAERDAVHRRRRRRGGRGRSRGEPRESGPFTHDTVPEHAVAHEDHDGGEDEGVAAEPQRQGAPLMGGEGGDHPEGGNRRRRRGRRGGRRNRHGRNGEAPFAGNEASFPDANINEASSPEPSLQHAVEDLDRPPAAFADERPPFDQPAPTFEMPASPPAAAMAESEPPRRRSTIRESVGGASAPISAPQATPVVSSSGEEPAAPKRGWWGRRLLGDKT